MADGNDGEMTQRERFSDAFLITMYTETGQLVRLAETRRRQGVRRCRFVYTVLIINHTCRIANIIVYSGNESQTSGR